MEVEAKAELTSIETAREKIIEMGGKLLFEGIQIDLYFQHPCRNFKETDEVLRIRKMGNNIYLTYKGPRINAKVKVREEIEVKISNHQRMLEILMKLGFKPVIEIRKKRETWLIGNMHVNLDEVEGLGSFIEIEVKSNRAKREEREIQRLMKKLGVGRERILRKTYFELIEEKKFNIVKGNKLIR